LAEKDAAIILSLLRNRDYALLWLSQLISLIGNWAMLAALPFFAFQITSSILATGIMFIVEVILPLLLASLAGVFVDRWDRRWTMIGANLVRCATLLFVLGFRSEGQIWMVYGVAVTQSIVGQFFDPAYNALMLRSVGREDLVIANSTDALDENVARIIAPPLGECCWHPLDDPPLR
jgi:MFS family permease